MEKCLLNLERSSVTPANLSQASWGGQWLAVDWGPLISENAPPSFQSSGLKTDELLHLLLCLCPFPSSLLNHFQVMSILFQQYLLLLSSFLHSYCHFINSGPDSSHASKFHKHLFCAALLSLLCVEHYYPLFLLPFSDALCHSPVPLLLDQLKLQPYLPFPFCKMGFWRQEVSSVFLSICQVVGWVKAYIHVLMRQVFFPPFLQARQWKLGGQCFSEYFSW